MVRRYLSRTAPGTRPLRALDRGIARGWGPKYCRKKGSAVTDGEILAVLGPMVRVRLDGGDERWAKLRAGSRAHPGQRVRMQAGPVWPVAVVTVEVGS